MKRHPAIIIIAIIDGVATVYSFYSPTVQARIVDIYLGSVAGAWGAYQMQSDRERDDEKTPIIMDKPKDKEKDSDNGGYDGGNF